MKMSELIQQLECLMESFGDQEMLVDTGMCLFVVDDVDMGASDEGVIIWTGGMAE